MADNKNNRKIDLAALGSNPTNSVIGSATPGILPNSALAAAAQGILPNSLLSASQPGLDLTSVNSAFAAMNREINSGILTLTNQAAFGVNSAQALSKLNKEWAGLNAIIKPNTELLNSATAYLNLGEQQQGIIKNLVGPLQDLQISDTIARLQFDMPEIVGLQTIVSTYEKQFTLPKVQDLSALIQSVSGLNTSLVDAQFTSIAKQMQSPWLNATNAMQSVTAFAQLQDIGQTLKNYDPFGDIAVSTLRQNLGDWRDVITWPANIAGDLTARTAFYIEHGYHSELTNFPAKAFEQSLELAELTDSAHSLTDVYGEPIPLSEDDDYSAYDRTNSAHRMIMAVEIRLRQFIDSLLTEAFGEEWPRRQLPNGMYDQWLDKKKKAEQGGRKPHPLIYYADFTDYEKIICKRDNFKILGTYFRTIESARESFQRLYLPRNEVMHARPISQDDELLLYAELKRLGFSLILKS